MKSHYIFFYLLLATIATLPFAGVRFFVIGVPIYIPELIVIIASALFVWINCHTDTLRIQKLPTSIVVSIILLLVGLFSSAFFNGITSVQLGIIKSWFFFPMLFGWLLFQTLRNQGVGDANRQFAHSFVYTKKVLLAWYATLVAVACIALAYFFTGGVTYDGRLKAFYLSPNYLALFLFPGVLLGWYGITQFYSQKRYQLLALTVISWILLCATLYLTLSYTVIAATIIGFCITLFLTSKRSYATNISLIAFCVIILSIFLVFQIHKQKFSDLIHQSERSSLASRMMIWQASAKMIGVHPLIGIGPGNFQETYLAYQQYFPPYLEWAVPHPHNLYLSFWLQTGIIGLIGFISFCVLWIRGLFHASAMNTKKAPLLWTLFGILITLLLIGFLDTPYFKTDLAYIFWLLLALGL